jgi:pimeloyl-ACP methyl ester carboxylesterase
MAVNSRFADTDRLRIHYLESGPADGVPVVLIHGNIATGRFFEHVMEAAPDPYRLIAPDMRGFGDSEPKGIDATRGLRDWADDTFALVNELHLERPHLVGWSTGGAAIASYAMDRPAAVATLTFIDPVSPYGFGGTRDANGTPTTPDFAGTGGAGVNPEFVERLTRKDRSAESPMSPRNVINSSFWSASHRETPEREDLLLEEVLKSSIGDDYYPGDFVPSENWPGFAPGTRGILNALSGKYCNWSGIVDIEPKPPILWTHGANDIVISDQSAWDLANLGKLGLVPGWPGENDVPPQPMVGQIRAVLDTYASRGGSVEAHMLEEAAHGPHIDSADRWQPIFFDFLTRNSDI